MEKQTDFVSVDSQNVSGISYMHRGPHTLVRKVSCELLFILKLWQR